MTNRNAFTTLEVILVVAILSLVVVAIGPYFHAIVSGWEKPDRTLELYQLGRVGMNEMTRLIRGATQFITVDPTLIRFIDQDGNDIRFRMYNNMLQKRTSTWYSLVEPIDNLVFSYFDSDDQGVTVGALVRSVGITLEVADVEGKVDSVVLASGVTIRQEPLHYAIVINEINYNPPGTGSNEQQREWIELYNYGTSDADLTDWQISDEGAIDDLGLIGGGTILVPAGGYALISGNPTGIYTDSNYYKDDIDTAVPAPIQIQVDDEWIGTRMADNSETITLIDSAGNPVDSVTYFDSWGGDGNGDTVERKDPQGPSNDASNWEASRQTTGDTTAPPYYRTPGKANSVTP